MSKKNFFKDSKYKNLAPGDVYKYSDTTEEVFVITDIDKRNGILEIIFIKSAVYRDEDAIGLLMESELDLCSYIGSPGIEMAQLLYKKEE